MKHFFIISILFFNSISAQNLSGVWEGIYGKNSTDSKPNFQMQILQTDSSFEAVITQDIYGKDDFGSNAVAHGVKKAKATLADVNEFAINNINIVEVDQISCQLSNKRGVCSYADYNFKLYKKGKDEFLAGKVFIKAGLDGDYYSENTLTLKKVNRLISSKDFPKSKKKYIALPSLAKAPYVIDFAKPIIPLSALASKKSTEDPVAIETRKNEKLKTIKVNSKQIELSIYDYGQIDHDIISVYVDKKPVLINKELTKKPLLVNFEMDNSNNLHEVILVAENLGDIPPNTALMKIKAGDKRYEIKITSNEQKNAVIVFKYKE